jgi:hypothetical protein
MGPAKVGAPGSHSGYTVVQSRALIDSKQTVVTAFAAVGMPLEPVADRDLDAGIGDADYDL